MTRFLVFGLAFLLLPLTAIGQENLVFNMTGTLQLLPPDGVIAGPDVNGFDGANYEFEAVFDLDVVTIAADGVPGYPVMSTTATVSGAASGSNGTFSSTQTAFFRPFFGDFVTAITATDFGPVFFQGTGFSLRASAGFEDPTRSFGNLLMPVVTLFEDDIAVESFGELDPAPLIFTDFANGFDPSQQSNFGITNTVVTVSIEGAMLGDVNCDGVIDLLDVGPFVNAITGGVFEAKADINQDGVVSLLDVQPFVDLLAG